MKNGAENSAVQVFAYMANTGDHNHLPVVRPIWGLVGAIWLLSLSHNYQHPSPYPLVGMIRLWLRLIAIQ